jgi:S-adenosylmethionine:tRNA ribosyltransferase-isomerase
MPMDAAEDVDAYDYALDPARIARHPVEPRDAAKLFLPQAAQPDGRSVADLPDLLRPGDLVVLNRTRVIPARLAGRKASGGVVEVLLVHPRQLVEAAAVEDDQRGGEQWACLVRGRVRPGTVLHLDDGGDGVPVTVLHCDDDTAERILAFPPGCSVLALADRCGRMPLPPYLERDDEPADRERYQTVFGDRPGSVAAPTAGLHLTTAVLERLRARGVATASVELRVGLGTFRPVTAARLADHIMHREWCVLDAATADACTETRARGGRIVALGTTVVRTLETAWCAHGGRFAPWSGWTDIFLHPPKNIGSIDLLLTNFHLPRSTLLMLVACLLGRERLLAAYAHAQAAGYRFFSYGDAMLVDNQRQRTAQMV